MTHLPVLAAHGIWLRLDVCGSLRDHSGRSARTANCSARGNVRLRLFRRMVSSMSTRQAVTKSQRSAKQAVTFWIRRLHMYLGLLNFSLLIVFGAAGLAATADVPELFSEPSSVASHSFTPPPNASDREVARLIAALTQPNHAGDPVVRRNDSNQLSPTSTASMAGSAPRCSKGSIAWKCELSAIVSGVSSITLMPRRSANTSGIQ